MASLIQLIKKAHLKRLIAEQKASSFCLKLLSEKGRAADWRNLCARFLPFPTFSNILQNDRSAER